MHIIRATLHSYDASTHRAAVQPHRSPAALLSDLPVADACPPALLEAGREVLAILWPDGGGAVLGPVGHVVSDWALPGELSVGGDLAVGGALSAQGALASPHDLLTPTYDLARRYRSRVGFKENAADNTAFDLVRFTASGAGAGSVQRGVCSGILALTFTGRHTGGYSETVSALYFVTVYAHAAQNLKADIQLLGARNEETYHTVTLTVREKAGASRSELTIEALATHAYFDANSNRTLWTYDLHSTATVAANYITPNVCE